MNKYFLLITAIGILSCSESKFKNPHIIINTSLGEIEAELYPDKAPKTVSAFLQFVDSGVYSNTSFYRVLFNEGASTATNTGVIQGGTWPSDNKKFPFVKNIPHESTKVTGLTHANGILSLARTGPGTASTEFFICIGNQNQFDLGGDTPDDGEGFSAFGKVVEGMDIVRKIQEQPKAGTDGFADKIIIYKIVRR